MSAACRQLVLVEHPFDDRVEAPHTSFVTPVPPNTAPSEEHDRADVQASAGPPSLPPVTRQSWSQLAAQACVKGANCGIAADRNSSHAVAKGAQSCARAASV